MKYLVFPGVLLKDIMKTFDSVNWRFLMGVLHAMKFPEKFMQWIQCCITSPMFSVAINGGLEGSYSCKRGLRQGDPFSPYLFVIVMEVLSQMLNKAAVEGLLPYHPKCEKIHLTHLCFADDLMVFTEGSLQAVQALKNVLNQFYELSGLKFNPTKCEMFCSGINEDITTLMVAASGFKLCSLPVKKIGVPLISGRLSEKECKPLIDRILKRIESWTVKHISFAGRLQLINSVLFSIQNYWCNVFILPKKVTRLLKQKSNAFLWKGKDTKATGTKVSWD